MKSLFRIGLLNLLSFLVGVLLALVIAPSLSFRAQVVVVVVGVAVLGGLVAGLLADHFLPDD